MSHRLLPLALTAALAASSLALTQGDDPSDAPDARVVVAPIDSGINPYHERFQVAESAVTEDVLADFGIDHDHVLEISSSYEDDVDRGVYEGVTEGELYHFAGTNILVWSDDFGSRPFLPDSDGDTHGTGVTGAIVEANPEAIVLFVEGISDASETYAFEHPLVDIVTTSYGFATSAPLGALAGSYTGVVEQGKLHFGASANDPTLAPTDGTSGPWWAIGIAGYGETDDPDDGEGKETLSGTAPDFVGDFTQDLPYCATCTSGTESKSGTSFATPRSAGTTSAILLEARRRAGHAGGMPDSGLMVDTDDVQLSNWDLRRALEEGAVIPGFSPTVGLTEQPVNPVAPYLHVGWGAITPDPALEVVPRTLDVLFGDEDGFKDQATCDHMTRYMTARYLSWDANPLSDSFGQTNALGGSPYVAC